MAEGDTNLQVYVASVGLLMPIMHGQIDQNCYFFNSCQRPPDMRWRPEKHQMYEIRRLRSLRAAFVVSRTLTCINVWLN